MKEDYFEKSKVIVAHIAGINEPVYLTDRQLKQIIKLQRDNNFVKVGKYIFRPSSILSMVEKTEELYVLPKYFQERLELEKNNTKFLNAR